MHLNGNEFKQIVAHEWYNASKLAEYDDEKKEIPNQNRQLPSTTTDRN